MRMVDLIIKKRDGYPLTDEEIRFWISGYVNGEIPDYQSSSMAMAIYYKGMNNHEIATLTDAMMHSGDVVDLSAIPGVKVDKHSSGGVGDKTSLVLGPMVAACGGKMAKMSGRGLGHTGGTLDKLESIPGMRVSLSEEEMIDQVNRIGIALIGQTKSLDPADKKLYALRDVTGTIDSIPLIASSIMSKKLASGTNAILLDVTVGDAAFMKNMEMAHRLAKTMVDIGNSLSRNTKAIISDMDEPLGNAVGNALEVKEAIEALHGHGPRDLMELCYYSGSIMLVQAHLAKDEAEARKMLEKVVNNGEAFKKLCQMVEAQGGDVSYLLHPEKFEVSQHVYEIKASTSGYVQKTKALEIGLCSMLLGAGRAKLGDAIDMSSGILMKKKVGDEVKIGETLCLAYTNKTDVEDVIKRLGNAFIIVKEKVEPIQVIKELVQ